MLCTFRDIKQQTKGTQNFPWTFPHARGRGPTREFLNCWRGRGQKSVRPSQSLSTLSPCLYVPVTPVNPQFITGNPPTVTGYPPDNTGHHPHLTPPQPPDPVEVKRTTSKLCHDTMGDSGTMKFCHQISCKSKNILFQGRL